VGQLLFFTLDNRVLIQNKLHRDYLLRSSVLSVPLIFDAKSLVIDHFSKRSLWQTQSSLLSYSIRHTSTYWWSSEIWDHLFTISFNRKPLSFLRPQRALHSILTSRLIINVREAAVAGQGDQECLVSTVSKSLYFANVISSRNDDDDDNNNDEHKIQQTVVIV